MITPSFSLTATERVLPNLALDFTTAILDPRVTFTRTGNTATVTNSAGTIVGINADLPRFEFNPLTLVCKGLLIEEQRTNLVTYSEDFSDASWGKFDATVIANTVVAPDGTLTGDKLIENTATSRHLMQKSLSSLTGTFTATVYAKASERTLFELGERSSIGARAIFNLANGTIALQTASPNATITSVGNGWYRCSITPSALSSQTFGYRIQLNTTVTSDQIYTGDGFSGIFIWGAQLEAGAFATSYIPTVASQVTRNADVVSMTGTNFSSWFNQSEGTFFTQILPTGVVNGKFPNVYGASDGSNTNSIRLFLDSQFSTTGFVVVVGNSNQASLNMGAPTNNTPYTFCSAYKLNSFASARNGGTIFTDALGTLPVLDRLNIGVDGNGSPSNPYTGTIGKLFYYPQRLTDNEVQAFSKATA